MLRKAEILPFILFAVASTTLFAEDAPAHAFAAPGNGSIAHTSAGGLGQVTIALLVVLVAIFAAAWLMRRLRNLGGTASADLSVVSQVALGARERAVIIRVGKTHLVLGVAPGRVNLLHRIAEGEFTKDLQHPAPDATARPSFSALLKKSLGR